MKAFINSGSALTVIWFIAWGNALAADKNGVSPQVVSLPSGPGSIQGLGESFQPQLNSGSGTFSVPIQLPTGPTGFAPRLSIDYHTGQGNGIVGIGWKLSGPTMVSRNMDHGLPFYIDGPNSLDDDFDGTVDNPEEIDRFSGVDLEELVPLADGSMRTETEGSFSRYQRVGDGWEVREKNGIRHEFGGSGTARLEHNGRMFAWLLERTADLNGNVAEYRYIDDAGSPGQKYLREVRWAQPGAFYAAVLSYDSSRPDVHADFRSGFEIRTGLRLARVDVIAQGVPPSPTALVGDFNGDGLADSLIRRYDLEYEANTLASRLSKVTLRGADGVTSLPPITFQYTDWIPPDNVSSSFTRSSGDPAIGLDSDNVELIDMNQDGLPDLLNASQTSHRIHLNLGINDSGRLEWDTVGTLVGNAPSLNLGSTAVHLADHSADGESDLIHKVNSATFQCYLNSGERSWSSPVNLRNTDTWPLWPFENSGSRTLDTDHNRLHDILFTGDNSYSLWMMMPGGRYGRQVPLPVLSDGTQAFRFEDPGARIADVNGDRINDLVWVQSTRVVYWASCGRGNFDGPIVLPFSGPFSLQVTEIPRVVLADINGDALSDLVLVRPAASPNGIHYFLNLGIAGFDRLRTIVGLPAVVCTGTPPNLVCDATRFADMNGNGSADFLISNSARAAGTREQFLDFVPGVRPNLLTRIDNGFGLVTTLQHESSVDQMVRARVAGSPWQSTMPISVPIVARITESDSRGSDFVREFAYRDPFYDSQKQEFRGFSKTQALELGDTSAPTRVGQTVFDTGAQAGCRKGMVLSQEVTGATGARFERVESTVQHRILDASADGRQVCYAFNKATDTFVFEQTASPVHLRAEYQFDDFGNMVRENMLGIATEEGDERLVERTFAYDPTVWLMNRVLRSTTRDGNGVQVADELFSYDPRGNLLEHRRWLNIGDRYVLAVRNEYDSFGNVIRMTDANGHSRSVVYDEMLHTFPIMEIVHLEFYDLSTSATYDLALGTTVNTVDFAGARSDFQYDSLGRLTVQQRPGGARTNYEYDLGSPISRIVTRVLEADGGGTFDRFDYSDGFGRKIGAKVEAEDGQWRFVDAVTFNPRKLENSRWLPYFAATPDYENPDPQMPRHTLTYDAQGRTVEMVNPDGTLTRTVFEPLVQHHHDENDTAGANTPLTRRLDGLDRVVEVTERNGTNEEYHTRYAWDTQGDLIEITDAQGNTKRMMYDSLRRNIALSDPDRGAMIYDYDDVGNLIRTTDARGQQIAYSFDFANRLVSENYLDQGGGPADPVDVQYVYDLPSENVARGDGTSATAAFTGGRLASVADLSGQEHRSYDARGNLAWMVKRIRDPQLDVLTPFMTGFTYDMMDRIVEVHYPDGDRCVYAYNSASFLESADGGPGGQVLIASATYEPTGQRASCVYGNGTVTTYGYDSRDRLTSLHTSSGLAGDVMHYAYDFDPASNVVAINDLRPFDGPQGVPADSSRRNTQRFDYDGLYRLTRARYTPTSPDKATLGTIHYSYDAIGNMLSQTSDAPKAHLGDMTYAGGRADRPGRLPGQLPGPHALTSTASGGVYGYDDNGNMTAADGATLTWDFKDRLIRYEVGKVEARYTYDYTGRRITKLVEQGKQSDPTFYVNQWFEYRPNGAPIKYVFDGPARLAQITGTLDPSRARVQRIWLFEGFNLLTIAVQTFQSTAELFGPGSRVYEWTGKEYREVAQDAFVPVATPLWVEVPSPRIAAAVGMYEPTASPMVIPAGQTLLPWPRLEPLVPSEHFLSVDVRVQVHDPAEPHWLLTDPSLPVGLTDSMLSFNSGSSVWLTLPAQTQLIPAASENRGVMFYHGDHLGSTNVMTDRQGTLLQEVAYFPFGAIRHSHEPGVLFRQPYGFTQKEQDSESDLHYFEARYLAGALSRFLTPDPKFANPGMLSSDDLASYLSQPQKTNLYSYVLNNPLNHVDPTGLDEASDVAASLMEGIGQAAEKTGIALEITEIAKASKIARDANISLEAAREITAFKSTPRINGVATGVGIALNVNEAIDFAKNPTLEKGAHWGGTTAITVGGFVSGPGAVAAGAAQYTYDNTPWIHRADNAVGDAVKAKTGSRVAGGVAAAGSGVFLTISKIAVGSTGGQGAADLMDQMMNAYFDED